MARSLRRGRSTAALVAGLVLWVCAAQDAEAAPLATAATAAPAAPSAAGVDVDFTYLAPPDCPPESELREQLRQRVDPSWESGVDRRGFVVRIVHLPEGDFAGRLEVTRARHETETREFRATTCRAVSTALVVFIAIALDPANAHDTPHETKTSPAPPGREPPDTSIPAPPPPPGASAAPAASEPLPRARARWWAFTSAVDLAYLYTPRHAWGARVSAQLAYRTSGARIAPALRASWGYADFGVAPLNSGNASFRFETARATACALVDLAPAPLTFAPCVGLDFGSLSATSNDIPRVGQARTSWVALAGLVRVSWSILPWLAVEGDMGLQAPFTRPSFALTEPVRIVYRPPSIFFMGGLGIAATARFP